MVPGSGTKFTIVFTVKRLKWRYLDRKHGEERDVAYAFSFPVRSKQRKTLLEGLHNKGDWQHNLTVLKEGNFEIVTWKTAFCEVRHRKLPTMSVMQCSRGLNSGDMQCREWKEERQRIKSAVWESSSGVQTIIHSVLQDHGTSHLRSDDDLFIWRCIICKKGPWTLSAQINWTKNERTGTVCVGRQGD